MEQIENANQIIEIQKITSVLKSEDHARNEIMCSNLFFEYKKKSQVIKTVK